ncbi:MAG TPA: tyrosine-type recombinase/integrase [Stellaceae bacterium]|nr:tyrosine-type recombinase/integrase [Stellaceae bacterium]
MPKITKQFVDKAAPTDGKRTVFWDDSLKGFGLVVQPSGVKTYVANYRVGGNLQREVIARHGVLTPDQARDRARQILAKVADGKDPRAEKKEAERAKMTVAELADLYLKDGPAEKPNKKASSWATDRSNIERHIKPLLGSRPAQSLKTTEVADFQADVAAGKNVADVKTKKRGRAIVSGGKGTAARSLAVLGAMLEFGVRRKVIPANPAKGVPLLKLQPKERFLTEAEVARLADAIADMESKLELSKTAAAAIRLLMLTGCRKSEILALRPEWVDAARGVLRLPDSKTGAKVVPLASAALELLAALPRDGSYVLPAAKGDGHYVGIQKDWEKLRERANLPGLRLHDLRHSFASFAVADGNSLYMIGKVLGHRQARTTEGYAHLANDPLRAVADRTANRISAAMKGKKDSAGEVVEFPKVTA